MNARLAPEAEKFQPQIDIFWTLGSGSLSVTAMLDFSGKADTSIHGLGEDDTANEWQQPQTLKRHSPTVFLSDSLLKSLGKPPMGSWCEPPASNHKNSQSPHRR